MFQVVVMKTEEVPYMHDLGTSERKPLLEHGQCSLRDTMPGLASVERYNSPLVYQ